MTSVDRFVSTCRRWLWLHYGTSWQSLYTLYEITFAGSLAFESHSVAKCRSLLTSQHVPNCSNIWPNAGRSGCQTHKTSEVLLPLANSMRSDIPSCSGSPC